jgi:putative redox protein
MSVKISCEYLGDLRVRAVHGPSGHVIMTDAPVDNQGKGDGFSPTDLAATAMVTCFLTILGIHARNTGLDLQGARAVVAKHMTTVPPRRIARLEVDITMPPGVPPEVRERLIRAAEACPVKQSFHPDTEIVLNWVWA